MIKTVKVKKKMRLDELIKYVWDNSVTEKRVFLGNHEQRVVFDNVGGFYPSGYAYSPDTTFTVEVDKEVTKNTPFEWLVGVNSYGSLARYEAATITDVLGDDGADCFATKIYALINNNLELIWEAE